MAVRRSGSRLKAVMSLPRSVCWMRARTGAVRSAPANASDVAATADGDPQPVGAKAGKVSPRRTAKPRRRSPPRTAHRRAPGSGRTDTRWSPGQPHPGNRGLSTDQVRASAGRRRAMALGLGHRPGRASRPGRRPAPGWTPPTAAGPAQPRKQPGVAQQVADPQARPAPRSWSGCGRPAARARPGPPARHSGSPGTASMNASSTTSTRPGRPRPASAPPGAAPRSGWSGCPPPPGRRPRAPRRVQPEAVAGHSSSRRPGARPPAAPPRAR